MSTSQLGARLGVTRQAVADLEHREAEGTVTLAALRKAAAAVECTLVYAVVPRRPMTDILRDRARDVAAKRLRRVAHSMRLEDQIVSDQETERQVEDLADDILRESPRDFWND